jgi:RNA polymerase sigma-70 factor, ECF subfamily
MANVQDAGGPPGEPDRPPPRGSDVEDEQTAAVYMRSCRPLIGLLTVMGGSATEAEEVAHDAFVRLLEHWSKVREYDDVDAWLRTVAVRLMISRHRRRAVASLGLRRLAARTAAASPGPSPDRVDLDAALAALPLTSRAVLLLHHVHDLPVDEVASLLRLPVGTVKSRLARSRTALAPLLTEGSPR